MRWILTGGALCAALAFGSVAVPGSLLSWDRRPARAQAASRLSGLHHEILSYSTRTRQFVASSRRVATLIQALDSARLGWPAPIVGAARTTAGFERIASGTTVNRALWRAYDLARLGAQRAVAETRIEVAPYAASNLQFPERAGQLQPPVQGRLAQPFGPSPRLSSPTAVRHSGLTWAAVPGEPVRSIARGFVAWAGLRDGFDGVVIIDHGDGYHSVYTQLSEVDAICGHPVAQGETVGRVGENRRIYMELRHLGDPVDPSSWLAHTAR